MKKNHSYSLTARAAFATLLGLSSVAFLFAIPAANSYAKTHHTRPAVTISPSAAAPELPGTGPSPAAGSIAPNSASPTTWVGTSVSPGGNVNSEANCVENVSCETFTLTVTGNPSDWTGKKLQVLLSWTSISNEYDVFVHKTSNAGPLVTSAQQGPGLTTQVVFLNPSTDGTGVFTIHVVYDTTPTSAIDPYNGAVSVVSTTGGVGIAPAPQDPGAAIGYENFEAPGVLTQGTGTSSGGVTVEYMGRGAGEPSIGVNWNSTSTSVGGMTNYQSDLETLFVSWDESCSLTTPKATWVNRRAPTSVAIDSDPIGFTDRLTGRVFASELTLLGPDTSKISYSDDDGVTWILDQQAQGLASAVDHQTMGGGPYHAPFPTPPPPLYPNSVYYCSQDIATAFCSRSDNGGLTFGSQTPLYNLTQCGGLHGHVKIAPDGTAYVPNRACGSNTALVVSTDNGLTWTVRPVQNGSVPVSGSSDDPAIGIDAAGKVYCLFALNGTNAAVGVSTDQGQTWRNIYDVGAAFGVQNVAFPAAVGGSAGRASVAFYGSKLANGDSSANTFNGVWHLYVAHTFDGGDHWTTTDVTPQLPMQRMGLLRGGGGPLDRNLLDFFDITIDKDGRVQVGYVNGCSGGPCSQAPNNANGSIAAFGNAYTVTATIARQSSGRRMLAGHDPASTTSVPGIPFVTQTRVNNVVRLAWNEADTGNSPITGYQILRGVSSNSETLLTTVPGSQTTYTDASATDATKTYFYKVVAVNAVGSSCSNNEIAAPYIGNTCTGLVVHQNLPTHPESTGGTVSQPPLPQLLIDYVAVGEPPSTSQLMFKMKVGNLATLPPNSRWRMVWDDASTPDEQRFVGMTTDQNSIASFEYGTLPTTSVVVVGVPTENPLGAADAGSNYNTDGTITILIAKSKVGSPAVGTLLGAVCGRTFDTGDTPPQTLERSNLLIDHTFVKGNTDNSYPPATYTVVGNTSCTAANIVPISAVSRKTHGAAGNFDVDLPLTGNVGIEDRSGGANGDHKIVVTFASPVTVSGNPQAAVTSGTGSVSSIAINGSTVTINLTGVTNAQTITVTLNNVNDGVNAGNVGISMGVLAGDTNADRFVNSADISQTKAQSGHTVDTTNFREDVNFDGALNSADISLVKSKSGTALP